MPVACPRCGTQNPDGNAYCQACGTLLTAPVAATAGAFAGPPPGMAPPPAYQSPYYPPSGPTVAVHRTPWVLIIAGVLVLTVLMAGAGTALAVLGNRGSQPGSNTTVGDIPSPTPGVTPSPVATATSPAQTGLQSNDGFSLNVPSGWAIDTKDNETMVITDPNGDGSLTVSSGASILSATAQQNKDIVLNTLKTKYPDVRECAKTHTTNTTLSGAPGLSFTMCFTLTSGSQSVPAAASVFVGANGSGSVYYLVMVLTVESNLSNYVNAAKPIVQSIHWKLS